MLSHDALTCLSRGYRNLYSRTPGDNFEQFYRAGQ